LLACGCGEVASHPGVDAATGHPDGRVPDAAVGTTYHGSTQQTASSPFGGVVYCHYTITLKQLMIDLMILPTGQVTTGHVQCINVEGTDANCPNGVIPASPANYSLQSATATASGQKLTFLGAQENVPTASLEVDLSRSGSSYSTVLTFHRIDQVPELNWSLTTTLPLFSQ
jgi:hypothetical protein